jgi:hypothetical protein
MRASVCRAHAGAGWSSSSLLAGAGRPAERWPRRARLGSSAVKTKAGEGNIPDATGELILNDKEGQGQGPGPGRARQSIGTAAGPHAGRTHGLVQPCRSRRIVTRGRRPWQQMDMHAYLYISALGPADCLDSGPPGTRSSLFRAFSSRHGFPDEVTRGLGRAHRGLHACYT